MTTAEVEKLLREEFKQIRNRNSITEFQWEEIKTRIWLKIKERIKR